VVAPREGDAGAVDGDAAILLLGVVVRIGSALIDAAQLVLGAGVIEDVLSSGRMLVLAATSESPGLKDLRRDGLGRFATEDDPTAAI